MHPFGSQREVDLFRADYITGRIADRMTISNIQYQFSLGEREGRNSPPPVAEAGECRPNEAQSPVQRDVYISLYWATMPNCE